MGYDCRCKKCGLDFVDMYGEFVNDDTNQIECPICGSSEILFYTDIPNFPDGWHPKTLEEIDELLNKVKS